MKMKNKFKFGDKVNVKGRNGIFWKVFIYPKNKAVTRRTYVVLYPRKGALHILHKVTHACPIRG